MEEEEHHNVTRSVSTHLQLLSFAQSLHITLVPHRVVILALDLCHAIFLHLLRLHIRLFFRGCWVHVGGDTRTLRKTEATENARTKGTVAQSTPERIKKRKRDEELQSRAVYAMRIDQSPCADLWKLSTLVKGWHGTQWPREVTVGAPMRMPMPMLPCIECANATYLALRERWGTTSPPLTLLTRAR